MMRQLSKHVLHKLQKWHFILFIYLFSLREGTLQAKAWLIGSHSACVYGSTVMFVQVCSLLIPCALFGDVIKKTASSHVLHCLYLFILLFIVPSQKCITVDCLGIRIVTLSQNNVALE